MLRDITDSVAALVSKAHEVYRHCRDCTFNIISALAPIARQLVNVLEDLADHLDHYPLCQEHSRKLQSLLDSARTLLLQIQTSIEGISANHSFTRNNADGSQYIIADNFKDSIRILTSDLSQFYQKLSTSDEGRIAKALSSFIRTRDEAFRGDLHRSAHSAGNTAWEGIANNLQREFPATIVLVKHRAFVQAWVTKAEEDGRLSAPPQGQRLCYASETAAGDVIDEAVSHTAASLRTSPSSNDTHKIESIGMKDTESISHGQILTVEDNDSYSSTASLLGPPEQRHETPIQDLGSSQATDTSPKPCPELNQAIDRDIPDLTTSPSVQSSSSSPTAPMQRNVTRHDDSTVSSAAKGPSRPIRDRCSNICTDLSNEIDTDDDLFGSTPIELRSSTKQLIAAAECSYVGSVENLSAKSMPKMESTVSGPLSLNLFDLEHAEQHARSAINISVCATSAVPHASSVPDDGKIMVDRRPPVPPKESISPPLASRTHRSLQSSRRSTPRARSEAGPPSPMRELYDNVDLADNAANIMAAFSSNRWTEAHALIQRQIDGVEQGAFLLIDDQPEQPSIKFMTFLQGVFLSFKGDFVEAKEKFDTVLCDIHTRNFRLDATEAAAAKWLGNTCILLNQSANAALVWSVCLGGIIASFGDKNVKAFVLAEDIRFLNQFTNALQMLKGIGKGFVGSGTNRDPTSIMTSAPASWKRTAILNTIDYCYKHYQSGDDSRAECARLAQGSFVILNESHLRRSVSTFNEFPFDHDPFFIPASSISLLAALSRPKATINVGRISTSSLGRSKSLFYKCDKGARWLVGHLRECLDSNAIEYKIMQNNILLRLSQSHSSIAYYQCFSIRFRKQPFRNTYGLKMTSVLLSTREFDLGTVANAKAMLAATEEDMPPDPEQTRAGLMLRIGSYLRQREKSDSQPSGANHELASDHQHFELPEAEGVVSELEASDGLPVELDAK